MLARIEGCAMGRIQPCVKDVLHIAYKTEDFSQAKARIEQLFVEAKAGHRGHRAVAQPLIRLPALPQVIAIRA